MTLGYDPSGVPKKEYSILKDYSNKEKCDKLKKFASEHNLMTMTNTPLLLLGNPTHRGLNFLDIADVVSIIEGVTKGEIKL